MKKRVFIWEFVWTTELIKHIIDLCDQKNIEISGWGIRPKDFQQLNEVWPEAPIFEAPLPSDRTLINFSIDEHYEFSFVEEENIRFLLDRESDFQNNMHVSQARHEIYRWALTVIRQTQPDWILFPDVPHNVFTYILYLICKKEGIKTQIIRKGLGPHLYSLSEGVERKFIEVNHENESINLSSETESYLDGIKKGGDEPAYMLKQKHNARSIQLAKRALSKGVNLFKKKSLGALVVHFKRRRLKRYYESLCETNLNNSAPKPYILALLHLQPERTTVPEGGKFGQQWLMVQMLSTVCSELGWDLFVKEHPSTFLTGPKFYRGRWFYDSLKTMPNLSLISTKVNSTTILKNAKAVATITGTVTLEAVIKGIPSLIFGESAYYGCPGTYRIKCISELRNAILSIKERVDIQFDDIKRFYMACEQQVGCYNTGITKHSDRKEAWLKGIPQMTMFSKMIDAILKDKQNSSAINIVDDGL